MVTAARGAVSGASASTPPRRKGAARAISAEELRKYSFLTAVCHEEHEAYYPTDGGAYLDRSYFHPAGLEDVRGYWRKTVRLIRQGKAPREIGLYIHWPFCLSRCAFCFCAMCLTSSRGEFRRYNLMLKREMEALRDVFAEVDFHSIYLGGGTPSLMPSDLLRELFQLIRDSFRLERDAEIYMEASPATLTPEKLECMRSLGVNHVTLGVQSLDNLILHKANRVGQNQDNVRQSAALLTRHADMISAADLMYGLDGQSDDSFLRDFIGMLKAHPRNLRVYAFDPRVQTAFSELGRRPADGLRERQWRMSEELDRLAQRCGYRPAPLDPEEPEYLTAITRQCRMARKWGASVLGIGMSALSHAFGAAWYGHPAFVQPSSNRQQGAPRDWNGLPPFYSLESSLNEEMRGFVIRHLHTQSRVSRPGFKNVFGQDPLAVAALQRALADLAAAGKVRIDSGYIRFLSKDRTERLVYCKHLFSPKLTSALLRGNRAKYRDFNRRFTDAQVRSLEAVADKRVASMMRMYYRPAAAKPKWFSRAMESENVCRLQRNGQPA
ncbi:MAG: radical SAM protein [Elusimicrobiota bacterium]